MRPMPRSAIAHGSILAVVLTFGSAASAQDSGAAAALFERGLADMQAGRFDAGCPKLAESYRLDLRPGVLFTLAECEAKWGRIASALAHYDDYLRLFEAMPPAQQAAQRERATVAKEKKAALKTRVPMLTLNLSASAPAGTIVKREGTVLGAPSLGTPVPVDPGKQRISTQTPDGAVKEQEISLEEGQAKTLDLELPTPAGPPASREPAPRVAPPEVAPTPPSPTGRRPWIYAAFGLGGAGVALGAVTGILAISQKGDIEDKCDGTICTEEGKKIADDAKTLGWVSTVAFGAGAAFAAAGLVLVITEPRTRARVSVGARSVGVAGEF